MVSLHCLSSTSKGTGRGTHAALTPVKIATLSFNAGGTHAAYAVHRSAALPPEGTTDPAHNIYVARACASSTDATSGAVSPSRLLPFSDWPITQVLKGVHTAPITALAWCSSSSSGALVSASADQCVYVWVQDAAAAQSTNSNGASRSTAVLNALPQLVMLSPEVLRSPTCVAWSVCGNKLYLGTAGGTVAVGRYDASQRWWICRMLLSEQPHAHHHHHHHCHRDSNAAASVTATGEHHHREQQQQEEGGPPGPSPSTAPSRDRVLVSVVPHPFDNTKVAVALLNGTVQVLSTYIKSVDSSIEPAGTHNAEREGKKEEEKGAGSTSREPFGHVYFTCDIPCWLHCLSWSASGRRLAAVGHDSALHVWQPTLSPSPLSLSPSSSPPAVGSRNDFMMHSVLRLRTLPLTQCFFVSDDTIVAAGFEGGRVYAFSNDGADNGVGKPWRVVAEGEAPTTASTAALATAADGLQPARPPQEGPYLAPGEENVVASSSHAAPSAEASHVANSSVKTAHQRAFELFERGSTSICTATRAAPSSAVSAAPQRPIREAGEQQAAEHTSHAPIQLLIPLSALPSTSAEPVEGSEKQQRTHAMLSVGSDGRVQVWCLRSDGQAKEV
jgi:hypothetical protein